MTHSLDHCQGPVRQGLALTILALVYGLATLTAQSTPAHGSGTWVSQAQGVQDIAAGRILETRLKAAITQDKTDQGEAALALGILYHNLARIDRIWLIPALDTLKALASANPEARAWYGSALTVKGGYAQDDGDIGGATDFTQQGLDAIDLACTLAPDNLTIRYLRVENSLSVSPRSPFKRWDKVRQDLAWLDSHVPLSRTDDRAKLLVYAGDLAMGEGQVNQAIRSWDKALRLAPGSAAAASARSRLAILEE